jgi:hypothetical protein
VYTEDSTSEQEAAFHYKLQEEAASPVDRLGCRYSTQNLLAAGFPKKVLKRCRPYVVLERNTLDKLARKRRKQGNIQNRIVGSYFTFKQ